MPQLSFILRRGRALLLALLTATLALPALAQDAPPGRVGRIAWMSGEVYVSNPDTGQLGTAPLNQPLTSGDIVATGPGARAEIQIGAMTFRLDSGSRVEFDRIDDERVRVLLNDGRLIAKLPTEESRRDFVLETAQGRFLPRDTGIFRFDDEQGSTTASAYFGSLRFDGRDTALDVNAGESARIWTDGAGQVNYRMTQGVRDEFTQWSAARDQRQRATAAPRYVSPEMTGVQDLDAYGDWSETPEYGAVWFPRAVAADWAPYRTGHWAWVSPWGWTWIGHEPWGFAPFHYGRWMRINGIWAWVPGVRVARPYYAPALVAWVGSPGISISLSIGSPPPIGWFPLAPREVYVPYYRTTTVYVQQVNAPHVTHIRNVHEIVARPQEVVRETRYIHRDEPRALSAAPSDAFRHRRPDVRITPRPGDVRDFREQSVQFAPPAPDPRRTVEPDRRQRPEPRPQAEIPTQKSVAPVIESPVRRERERPETGISTGPQGGNATSRQEPEIRRGDDRERARGRNEVFRSATPPAPAEPPRPAEAPRPAEPRFTPPPRPAPTPAPAVREQRPEPPPEVRREAPRPAIQRAEPPAPPVVRQAPQERPREVQRPAEPPRHEMRVETQRQERIQPAQRVERPQERREQREPREERRERGHRPGEPERR